MDVFDQFFFKININKCMNCCDHVDPTSLPDEVPERFISVVLL